MRTSDLIIVSADHLVPKKDEYQHAEKKPELYMPVLQEGDTAICASFSYHIAEEEKENGGVAYLLVLRDDRTHRNPKQSRNLSDLILSPTMEEELRPLIEAYLVHEYGRVHTDRLDLVVCNNAEGVVKWVADEHAEGDEPTELAFFPSVEDSDRFSHLRLVVSYGRRIWSDRPLRTELVGFDVVEHTRYTNGQSTVWDVVNRHPYTGDIDKTILTITESGSKSPYRFQVWSPFQTNDEVFIPYEETSFYVTARGEYIWANDEHLRNVLTRAPLRRIRKPKVPLETA